MVSTYTTVSELEPDSMGFMHKKVFVRRLALFLKVHRCIFIISPTSRRFISNSIAIAESWLMVDRIIHLHSGMFFVYAFERKINIEFCIK